MKDYLILFLFLCVLTSGCQSRPEAGDDLEAARQAYVEHQYLEAERLYERYLKIHEKGAARWEVWNRLYDLAYAVRGNESDALELLEAMLLEYADKPEKVRSILYRMGDLAMQMRDMEKAVDAWQRILDMPESTPLDQVTAYRNIGEAYIATADYDLAIDAFRSCMEIPVEPVERAQCLYGLAQTQFFLENYHPAVVSLTNVLETKGISQELASIATLLLSDAYDQLGRIPEAITLLEGIADTYPNPMVIEKRLEYLRKRM